MVIASNRVFRRIKQILPSLLSTLKSPRKHCNVLLTTKFLVRIFGGDSETQLSDQIWVRINSKSNAEFGPLNWVGCGFYKTSGNFRVGQYKNNQSINSFSHRVKWAKGERGAIRIYPRKGDVWALYRNWSPEWNENTPDDVIHQYDMVVVLDEFNEEKGIAVIPLVKVVGFKTVFRQHEHNEQAKVIRKEEMFRFSHQVPSYLLTGQESPSAPKGCLELDPAATPMELLQVIPETREDVKKDDTENPQKSQQSAST